ncbi:uncharacterized protein LOC119292308 [Triticum dicoccoides]|uniref:uncharacterized protein LOC119292308 n=1 Tax=Triticum dicoccoides TaxID=85692 RepID=UPI00188F9C51|nr:uncharacterized protein LOC119292308 [Triticum dicoccoides]
MILDPVSRRRRCRTGSQRWRAAVPCPRSRPRGVVVALPTPACPCHRLCHRHLHARALINSPHRLASREEDAEANNKERLWVHILGADHKCCEKPWAEFAAPLMNNVLHPSRIRHNGDTGADV